MFKPVTAPYLVPSPSCVSPQPWFLVENEEELRELSDFLPNWNQGKDLILTRNLEVDVENIRESVGLPSDARLALAVSWSSNQTKLRTRVFRAAITDPLINVRIRLSGNNIGGKIILRTTVILDENISSGEQWVPHEAGSILLEEKVAVTLEGEGAAFPMAVVNFVASALPASASWHLTTSSILDARFSSAFQILINENDKALVKAIESEKPTREQLAVLDELKHSIISFILEYAYLLRSQGLLSLSGYEEGSVGDVLSSFIVQTGDQAISITNEPSEYSLQRSFFDHLARTIGAGRYFK